MHPTIHNEIAKARIADMHLEAQRNVLARSVRRARMPSRQLRLRLPKVPTIVVHRLFTVLSTRSSS
jgi:hypothetical protein